MRYLHTMLRVRDLDAAIAFYSAAFGYQLNRRRAGRAGSEIAFLHLLGDEENELQLAAYPNEPDFTLPDPLLHIALGTDDLEAALSRAIAAGAKPESEPYTLPSGSRVCFVRDRDGYEWELIQKP